MELLDRCRAGQLLATRAALDIVCRTTRLLLDELVVTLLAHARLLAIELVLGQGGQAVLGATRALAHVLLLSLVWLGSAGILLMTGVAFASTGCQRDLLHLTIATGALSPLGRIVFPLGFGSSRGSRRTLNLRRQSGQLGAGSGRLHIRTCCQALQQSSTSRCGGLGCHFDWVGLSCVLLWWCPMYRNYSSRVVFYIFSIFGEIAPYIKCNRMHYLTYMYLLYICLYMVQIECVLRTLENLHNFRLNPLRYFTVHIMENTHCEHCINDCW